MEICIPPSPGKVSYFFPKVHTFVKICHISAHYLFNIYAENIVREALEEWEKGISIGGRMVTNLRYADDTTLLAGTKEGLIKLVGRVKRASEKAGLYLHVGKTKVMTTGDIGEVTVDGKIIRI